MTKYIAAIMISVALLSPISASASTLTRPQVAAIINLLIAFGVDSATIKDVENQLTPKEEPVVFEAKPAVEEVETPVEAPKKSKYDEQPMLAPNPTYTHGLAQ